MLITLLFLSHALVTAEWVEINQQHYLKSVKVIPNPASLNTPNGKIHQTSISIEKPGDNEDKATVKPNRIYINHTISDKSWNDDIFADYSDIPESSTKLTRQFRPDSNNNNNLAKLNTIEADKTTDKGLKVKEIVKITDKRLGIKNTEKKLTTSKKKPNRIYIENEHSGSLEVYELSDLENIAEEDSEEYFRKHIDFKQTSPENEASAQTIREKYNDHATKTGNKTLNKTKEPCKLFNKNNLIRVEINKKINSQHVSQSIETDSRPDKSTAYIKKHMVAKITKVDIPNKIKTSAEKNKMASKEDERDKSNFKMKDTQFDKNLQNVIKTTKSNISDSISITTKNPSEVKKRNRYDHRGTNSGEKVPDPEAIMIKEILGENEHYDADVTSTSTEKSDKDNSGKKVVGDPEYKKHAKTKGQKAPDPDAAMIQELLSEVAEMSHATTTTTDVTHQPNNKIGTGTVQTVNDISARKPSKKSTVLTQIHMDKLKKTDVIPNQVSSQESTSVKNKPVTIKFKEYQIIKQPATIYDNDKTSSESEKHYTTITNLSNADRKTDKIGKIKIPDINNDDDIQLSTEKILLTTPEINSLKYTTDKGSEKLDSEQYSYKPVKIHTSPEKGSIEFDSREYSYKPVIRLHEEIPEFVSKEDFFTESAEIEDLNDHYSEHDLETSTSEPVTSSTDNESSTVRGFINNDVTAAKIKEEEKTTKPKDEEINTDEKKDSTMDNVIKLLKVVTDIIARNTRKSFTSKVRYLERLKDTLLANIEERIEATFPSPARGRSARSGSGTSGSGASGQARAQPWSVQSLASGAATARGHVDFPSSESSLMTISFLTFAVFLIKLVLQVIQTYKSKTAIPSVVAAVGRAAGRWQHGRY